MLRRFLSSHLKTLAAASSSSLTSRSASAAARFPALSRSYRYFSTQSGALSSSFFIFSFANRLFVLFLLLIEDATAIKKKFEDVMPIATGHEREELEAELEGRDILEIDHPEGPFGTKIYACVAVFHLKARKPSNALFPGNTPSRAYTLHEAPAIVKSYYDKRIVGCPGGEGEDEHDVVWFWLEKGKPHECPVCAQYFVTEMGLNAKIISSTVRKSVMELVCPDPGSMRELV
ncbi:Cytochrome c oxidase subunit 5b-2 [Vigna angularis]|uniref:Cytochrome c oxidase subunit 5b-2 n=1 Tax=Phaseolus angularis TaxID=3914 RepID=A0A8T0JRC0_PHAAN|nr:Cytochrome c oxidase subunit 5b-2 [Vigna angularis]